MNHHRLRLLLLILILTQLIRKGLVMNFQLHLSHGVELFLVYSLIAAVAGYGVVRLLSAISPGSSPDERVGSAVFGLFMLGFTGVLVVVGIVMAFICQYAAYAFIAAVFCLALAIGCFSRS